MDGSDILSFVRNPSFLNQSSVHDRLYQDFTRRSHQKKLIENGTQAHLVKKPSPMRLTDIKIEDSLMIKYKASQSRLTQLRARYQSEESKNLKPAPTINQNSRRLAESSSNENTDIKSQYISSILQNSRLSRMVRASSMDFIKSPVIKLNNDSTTVYNSIEEYEKSKKLTRNYSGTKDKNKYLNELREAVSRRPNVLQHEEPPNLLEMTVIERGKYWSDKKEKKIERNRVIRDKEDLTKCTFSPDITPLKGLVQSTPKTACSLNLSYSQIHLRGKMMSQSFSCDKSKSTKSGTPKVQVRRAQQQEMYQSLSPCNQRLSHKSGIDLVKFLKKSKPMQNLNN